MLAIETIQPRDKLYWQSRALEAEAKLAEIRKLLDDHAMRCRPQPTVSDLRAIVGD